MAGRRDQSSRGGRDAVPSSHLWLRGARRAGSGHRRACVPPAAECRGAPWGRHLGHDHSDSCCATSTCAWLSTSKSHVNDRHSLEDDAGRSQRAAGRPGPAARALRLLRVRHGACPAALAPAAGAGSAGALPHGRGPSHPRFHGTDGKCPRLRPVRGDTPLCHLACSGLPTALGETPAAEGKGPRRPRKREHGVIATRK